MCLDIAKRNIYVFGGRILSPKSIEAQQNETVAYSGLYSYHIPTNTWTQILVDCDHPTASNPEVQSIKSRETHCMVFHHVSCIFSPKNTYSCRRYNNFLCIFWISFWIWQRHRKLYIFGGRRNKEYTTDFIAYDVDTQNVTVVNTEGIKSDKHNVPQTGYTLRATIDCERDEIYVLSVNSKQLKSPKISNGMFKSYLSLQSLSKEKERRDANLNSFWIYSIKTNKWSSIYKSEHSNEHCYSKLQTACSEPCPRYAHQLVYDWVNKVHYLFGGSPDRNTKLRLDDFWLLYLKKWVHSKNISSPKVQSA